MIDRLPEEAGGPYATLAWSVAADLPKLVLKHHESFLVADRRGDFPHLPGEFGFYVEGTRFLRRLELLVHGFRPLVLNAMASEDEAQVAVDLSNPDVAEPGHSPLPGQTVRLARRLMLYENQLFQTLTVESFAPEAHELALTWRFSGDFADVFEVRGLRRSRRGRALPPQADTSTVRLAYQGLDGVTRVTELLFDPAPHGLAEEAADYRLTLEPGGRLELSVTASAWAEPAPSPQMLTVGEVMRRRRDGSERLEGQATKIHADREYVNRWVERARTDLHMLLTETADGLVAYAGIPWYVAPFGRDSLIAALQVLPFEPEIARGTLRFLARYQGERDDPFTDQEPGKILHEYRRGELAACREIAFVPYYGSVDATPLFLIALAEYMRWTHDVQLARQLWPAAERALAWMTGASQAREDGYLRYVCRSPRGLVNQGWKDSREAVMHASGALASPPIAMVEAQGYQYAALLGGAALADITGHADKAPALRERARRLREAFERDFWLEEEGFYALALDGEGNPCRVITSNPGHCLWAGIVAEERAPAVARRLMAGDMFTGWGLRTLAARERRYNPMSYHTGSVWPHDTALAAGGLRRYGFTAPFLTLATGLFEAVLRCEGSRMPELFCGFPRLPGYGPTRYPVACSPQAWAAGVIFQLLSDMLQFEPDAAANRLTLSSPILPPWLNWLELRGLRVRESSIDLVVSRGRQGGAVEVIGRRGNAEVVVRR
jgi:glycogen debranching enzyme